MKSFSVFSLCLLSGMSLSLFGCASETDDTSDQASQLEMRAPTVIPKEDPHPVPWYAPVKVFKQPASVVNDVPQAPSGGGTKNESEK